MKDVRFSSKLYAASRRFGERRFELEKHMARICGADPRDSSTWPFEWVTWDDYDNSFELKEAVPELRLSPDGQIQATELGFSRCWICHTDGMETLYWFGGGPSDGHRKTANIHPNEETRERAESWRRGYAAGLDAARRQGLVLSNRSAASHTHADRQCGSATASAAHTDADRQSLPIVGYSDEPEADRGEEDGS